MKTESNIMPLAVAVAPMPDGNAEVILATDVKKATKGNDGGEKETYYTYDEYRLVVPDRPDLRQAVQQHLAPWLDLARETERTELATQVRARRDKLLQETDPMFVLDRLGLSVPKGSGKIGDWLKFLQEMGDALASGWATYRQALRDVPQQPGFPYDVTFPDRPKD